MSGSGRSGMPGGPGGMGGLGGFGEAFDEQSLSQMASQMGQSSQSAADPSAAGPSGMPPGMPPQMSPDGQLPQMPSAPQDKPREVGSLKDELIIRPLSDIKKELGSFFDLNALLGIKDPSKDPQVLAHKQQMMQGYNKVTEEIRAVTNEKFQKLQARRKQEEEEKAMKKQREEQARAASIEVPSSPKKGPVGPAGSGKQRAVTKLEQDRKTLGGPASAN